MSVRIVFLGTGGSWPSPERNVLSIAVKKEKEIILLDCGEGTQRQFMLSPLSFMQTKVVLLSHFHGDHFLGLPGLIQSMTLNDREDDLLIYGPEGTVNLVAVLLELGYFNPGFRVEVRDLKPGDVVDFDTYKIVAFKAEHNVPSLGFCIQEPERAGRFDLKKAKELGIPEGPLYRSLQRGEEVKVGEKVFTPEMVLGPPRRGRKIVYTGDTTPSREIAEIGKDCDVLIHDATAESSMEEKANRYGHSTAKQAAMIAKECNAKVLFLVHISPRYDDATPLLEEAKQEFENSILTDDLMEYEVRLED
jgi:ribonuclease Z